MSEMPRTETFQQATEITQDYSKAPPHMPVRNKLRRAALALALLAGTAAIAYYGHDYWTNGRYLETTDDAYVKADSTIVAPKVSGYIATVLVGDNEKVKAGQVLARIDDRDFKAALDQARADVAAAEASVRNLDAQLGDLVQVLDDLVDVLAVLAEIEADLGGLLDRVVVAALGLAVAAQHIQLPPQLRGVEDVARVGVPGDEPERLLLAGAADEDGRMRLADRLR